MGRITVRAYSPYAAVRWERKWIEVEEGGLSTMFEQIAGSLAARQAQWLTLIGHSRSAHRIWHHQGMRRTLFASILVLSCLALTAGEDPPPADLAAPPAEALKAPSGLAHRVLRPGQGRRHVEADALVVVHFSGWTLDGKRVLHSERNEAPPHLFLTNLMPGMREALLDMTEGEQRRLWIPEALAFNGAKGRPVGPITMDLELIEVQAHPSKAPQDVAAPPVDAQLLKSGLAYKILRPGTGREHPTRSHWVNVHYSGWTTDGKLFDSSLLRRESAGFKVADVIPGWIEGLQLMVAGERRRFWVPEKLAYRGERGKPAGMLVFDVELLSMSK
ncbi:FKBP-type peptidyl-prolyl cis-trans isomerase [Geothrix sp. PMB-07]|uniref:FKBP-type peptidyl-prolyl cis-trans isomerase n=1 Tax=Geothrix sp. PMB-07 TaxID=3068640 RepID=UPI0027418C8A|nr:FKBP-type peptidyl-prolyl cis-trans isomerase [Geothrix sp. PMB-07]WLT31876.1 FKBP-type peptidyl-prolyl cis-trans isomerase [Geothrix sp. PMB-07]